MAYKGASQKAQHSLRRVTPGRLGDFKETMSDKDRLKLLKEKVSQLERQLFLNKNKKDPERIKIALQKHQLTEEIVKLKPKKFKKDSELFFKLFYDICKDTLPTKQFDRMRYEASMKYEEYKKEQTEKPENI